MKNLKRFSVFFYTASTLLRQLIMWTYEFNKCTGKKQRFIDWLEAQDHKCKLRLDLTLVHIDKVILLNVLDFDYSHERTEVRTDYRFSVGTCHCALLIYRNYTGPWISLWETRNCSGIFPTTSSFIGSFLQQRQSWRCFSYCITNMPFSQPHHTSTMNLPKNTLCQPQIVLYYLT